MTTLGELAPRERKELARSLAKEIWIAVDHHGEMPGLSLEAGVYKVVGNSDLLHESNFYGEGFNEAQNAKIKEFHDHRGKGCDLADQYDKDIANGVGKFAPAFAMPSEALRRAWTTNFIIKELCKEDSPFGTLRTADAIEDMDRTDESNDENQGEEEEEAEESEGEESGGEESGEEEESEEEYLESDRITSSGSTSSSSSCGSEARHTKWRTTSELIDEGLGDDSGSEDGDEEPSGDPAPPPPPKKRKKPVRECERKPDSDKEDQRGLLDSDSD